MTNATLYEIRNLFTNQRYIGVTTTPLYQRWAVHLYKLRHGLATEKFQKAFNEYGELAFVISVISNGCIDELRLLEKGLTKETIINGYNTIIGGGDAEERSGAAMVFQATLKNNPEYENEFYKSIGEKNRGKVMSAEARAKMSAKKKGVKWEQYKKDDRAIQYSGSGNPNFGKYAIYLNMQTGVFYNTLEMVDYFGLTKHGFKGMLKRKDYRLNNFVKV